ncbi:MAG: hypothetical protein AAB036_03875 [Elusimicrobiota bacterium]
MKRLLIALLVSVAAVSLAEKAAASLTLEAAGWQTGVVDRPARPAVWKDAQRAALSGPRPLLRGKAVLTNRGPKPAEGILIHYLVSARLVPDKAGDQAAAWALAFINDEKRIPKVGANQTFEAPLSLSPRLEHYLKKIRRQGFHAVELKIQAMLELKDSDGVRVVESTLEVAP